MSSRGDYFLGVAVGFVRLGVAFEIPGSLPRAYRGFLWRLVPLFSPFGASLHALVRQVSSCVSLLWFAEAHSIRVAGDWRAEVRFGCRDARILPRGAVGISFGALF